MNTPWSAVETIVQDTLAHGACAGMAISVRTLDGELLLIERGRAEVCPSRRDVRPGQVWDVASLTKVLATASICAVLVDRGELDLDAPLVGLLPGAPEAVTPRMCLSHASGFPAWRRLFDLVEAEGLVWGTAATRQRLLERCWTTPLEAEPGRRHRYSDIGMLALCAYLEQCCGARIDVLWQRLVGDPTGIDLRWGWPGAAATELCPLRGRVVVGEVHDLNAAVLGGVASHAGLFGSASSVSALGVAALRGFHGDSWISKSTTRAFWSHEGPGSHHLGWDGVSPGGSSAGHRWPLDGVGHLGFTGCSLWLAPQQGVAVAVLANRVHPVVEGGAVPGAPLHPRYRRFKAMRPAVHTAVVDALEQLGVWRA